MSGKIVRIGMRGDELDFYLSVGYYRMQQEIFTCQFVQFDTLFYTVHWLRLVLADVAYGKNQQRLLRTNQRFSAVVKSFVLTNEIESLYARYRGAIDFDAPESVAACLLDGTGRTNFDTCIIEIRDGEQLIAGGIFDAGAQSIAGIMNFYHPDYRKYSLGKYLMLLKINYAIARKKAYYYPGYLVSGYPKFDYKLFACPAATEVFDNSTGLWLPFSWELVARLSADMMGTNESDDGLP